MSKLGLIIKREYLAKVRNRSFVIMTFLSPILMVGMVVLIAYLTKINDSETRVVGVLNESVFYSTDFGSTESMSFVIFEDVSLEQAKDSVINQNFYGLLYLPEGGTAEEVANSAFLYTKEAPISGVVDRLDGIFRDRLRQQRLLELGVTPAEFASIDTDFQLRTETFEGERNLKGLNELKAFIGGGFGYLIMMFIIIYGGFVMRSVIEEKTSRIIEVIISSVKPFQLMMGKIIGTSLAGLTQFAIWIFSASLLLFAIMSFMGLESQALESAAVMPGPGVSELSAMNPAGSEMQLYANELMRIPWVMLIFFFMVYFVLGYLIYSSIYAAIGAAVDNETDTQQFIFPIILPLMLAIYVGFFSVFGNPHGPIAVGFSLFPLTSPIVMLMRLPGGLGEGGVPIWQLVLSIFLLLVTFIGIVWLAAKIYRVGILMYGKKASYKELFKWLKY
ncbi:ABC-2 type transport system permease protein [Muriicola jejuensis]|uniref:ABC transporter permease n=1 Tax=Muriicola jejuensis TaxID=504488 RepID=A0A6P0UDZ1_9FLAO|nr:ABC transporter permease [Muriicola jejuensis]NER10700.1 ABC transporter permease [Muriicola jejuensis]SMP16791.1 ABC-2 type transport system permease protein [Muriicola jejuensis]